MVEKTITGIRQILEKDYAAVIRRKLDEVYRSTAAGSQKNEKLQQENFIVGANDKCRLRFSVLTWFRYYSMT
jgi:conserved oligomeric Golgi complex subunit 4